MLPYNTHVRTEAHIALNFLLYVLIMLTLNQNDPCTRSYSVCIIELKVGYLPQSQNPQKWCTCVPVIRGAGLMIPEFYCK